METSRTVTDAIGNFAIMMSRSRVFLYPVIYISQYDVLRTALVGFLQSTVARITRQPPSTTN